MMMVPGEKEATPPREEAVRINLDPLSLSPKKARRTGAGGILILEGGDSQFEAEETEVMELADPTGYLSDASSSSPSLVYNIPVAPTTSPHHRLIPPTEEEEEEEDLTQPDTGTFNWLSYPAAHLNALPLYPDWTKEGPSPNLRPSYHFKGVGGRMRSPSPPSAKAMAEAVEEEEDDGWETVSSTSADDSDDEGEWEETLVYVQLDDLPSVQELFALHPDDFLRFQHRRVRILPQPLKATHQTLNFQFHHFHTPHPILQIRHRYFACSWEQPTGSALFFRKKSDSPPQPDQWSGSGGSGSSSGQQEDHQKTQADAGREDKGGLKDLLTQPDIPWDPVFGPNLSRESSYEMVGMADRILKATVLEAGHAAKYNLPTTNSRQFLGRLPPFKIPKGYTLLDILTGRHGGRRRRRVKRRRYDTEGKQLTTDLSSAGGGPAGNPPTDSEIITSDIPEKRGEPEPETFPDVQIISDKGTFMEEDIQTRMNWKK